MSNNLAANRTVELLESLKATVEEFARRSARLEEEHRSRLAKERLRAEGTIEEQRKELAAKLSEADGEFEAQTAATRSRFERRKVWIGKAYQSSREKALQQVDDAVGSRKYRLQKEMLQAERDRDAALANATQQFEEFKTRLSEVQGRLAGLEIAAQRAFRGYGRFMRQFRRAYQAAQTPAATDERALLDGLAQRLNKAENELERFGGSAWLKVFKYFPLWCVLALAELGLVPVLHANKASAFGYAQAAGAAVATMAVVWGLRFWAQMRSAPLAESIAKKLAEARVAHDACLPLAQARHEREWGRIRTEFAEKTLAVDRALKEAVTQAGERRVAHRMRSDERTVQVQAKHQRLFQNRLERTAKAHDEGKAGIQKATDVRIQALSEGWRERERRFNDELARNRQQLEAEWRQRIVPLAEELRCAKEMAETLFPAWSTSALTDWKPPAEFARAARFGLLKVELETLCEAVPRSPGLTWPGNSKFCAPLCLGYPEGGSILFETGATGHEQAIGALNNVILRLLSVAPPGRLNFTILDPVGLGQNFAGIMHLADFEEQIINSRIWTQPLQIEEKLRELNEHMEKVIQMYLRNEYKSIAEYNEQAGVIAEKYHFLVVADFPANFTDTAAKRLLSIAASGARCGVYMLILWDQRIPLPQDFIPDELRKTCLALSCKGKEFVLTGRFLPGTELLLDAPPAAEQATEFIQRVGQRSKDSSRVEVPFEQVAPAEEEIWTEETTSEVRVPIGRTGATKLQYLAIGKGTCQHGLIGGKTGSGKSTLFHVIITNLSLWCSPEQVEFYLVDFKKGVEFKCYATRRLPHARVVAIESDREFGLSVLQRIDDELKRRGDLFRDLGVQDLPGYKRAGGKEKIPRTLLMVDEFQEFFVEDDKVAQSASLLLDRIVRQGRAFGIHVLLGSQTLGGAYTVARSTLGQMVIRIALQCNEADAYLIMDDGNPAPRLLSRPGEGIYNDMAGALEGNSPFQTVWLADNVRDESLEKVRRRADAIPDAYPGPIVFEGNAPANVRENRPLRALLEAGAIRDSSAARIWLGAPNSIKGPTEAMFRRQSGNNILIVGQREEATLAILTVGLVSLAAQHPLGRARFIFCDATPPETPQREYIEKVVQGIPHRVQLARPGEVPAVMEDLDREMKARGESSSADSAPPVYMFVHDLPKFSRLRYEEDFGFSSSGQTAVAPAAVLNQMICEGPRLGFHLIFTCDTYNNVNRFLSRKAFSEFELRVLYQMSVNDSASLIDNPKAGMLGLHRALFFNAQEGYLETFRPYALPGNEWLKEAAANLERLLRVAG